MPQRFPPLPRSFLKDGALKDREGPHKDVLHGDAGEIRRMAKVRMTDSSKSVRVWVAVLRNRQLLFRGGSQRSLRVDDVERCTLCLNDLGETP